MIFIPASLSSLTLYQLLIRYDYNLDYDVDVKKRSTRNLQPREMTVIMFLLEENKPPVRRTPRVLQPEVTSWNHTVKRRNQNSCHEHVQ
jgi:hypothetical protein